MKRSPIVAFGLALVIACGFSSCTVLKFQARPTKPVYITDLNRDYEVIRHFSKSKGVYFDYTRTVDVTSLLAEALLESKADAVVNLNMKVKYTGSDFFMNLITLGGANAYTVEVEGDLIKLGGKEVVGT
jgi:hypothetical protein